MVFPRKNKKLYFPCNGELRIYLFLQSKKKTIQRKHSKWNLLDGFNVFVNQEKRRGEGDLVEF